MPQAGKPHWGHGARIYIYASTLPTFLTPHSYLSTWNPYRTQSQQIIKMPSTRTGQWYSARPSMPSSSTLRQGSHTSSPSLTISASIFRMNPQHHPFRIWQNHKWQWRLWWPHGYIISTNQFIFKDYHYATPMNYCTETEKTSRQTRDQSKKDVYGDGRIRIAASIVPTLKYTPLEILLISSTTTHSILSCTRPGDKISRVCWMIPYPSTNITTTRRTRKPNHHCRWWWGWRWKRWQLLFSRINLLHANLLSSTLSRMSRPMTPIPRVSSIYMWSLLTMSANAQDVWLSRTVLQMQEDWTSSKWMPWGDRRQREKKKRTQEGNEWKRVLHLCPCNLDKEEKDKFLEEAQNVCF